MKSYQNRASWSTMPSVCVQHYAPLEGVLRSASPKVCPKEPSMGSLNKSYATILSQKHKGSWDGH